MSIHKSLLYTIPAVWATRAIAILDFLFIIRSSESRANRDTPRGFRRTPKRWRGNAPAASPPSRSIQS